VIDPLRGTGRTTKQMLDAPQGAVFISAHAGSTSYDWGLAQESGRTDLRVVAPTWLTNQSWRGLSFTGIVVDHAARLNVAEKHALQGALTRVRSMK